MSDLLRTGRWFSIKQMHYVYFKGTVSGDQIRFLFIQSKVEHPIRFFRETFPLNMLGPVESGDFFLHTHWAERGVGGQYFGSRET